MCACVFVMLCVCDGARCYVLRFDDAPAVLSDPGRLCPVFSLHAVEQTVARLPFVLHMPGCVRSSPADVSLSADFIKRQECSPCATQTEVSGGIQYRTAQKYARTLCYLMPVCAIVDLFS